MASTIGYKIENGLICIDEVDAEKVKQIFVNYLSGYTLIASASTVGLKLYHGSVRRILTNKHYLGDEVYPKIIDEETFYKVEKELDIRGKSIKKKTKKDIKKIEFSFSEAILSNDDPFLEAELNYRLIKTEVIIDE